MCVIVSYPYRVVCNGFEGGSAGSLDDFHAYLLIHVLALLLHRSKLSGGPEQSNPSSGLHIGKAHTKLAIVLHRNGILS